MVDGDIRDTLINYGCVIQKWLGILFQLLWASAGAAAGASRGTI
jgi:hypothetical protein